MRSLAKSLAALAALLTLSVGVAEAQNQQPPTPPAYSVLGGASLPISVTSSSSATALPIAPAAYGAVTVVNEGTVDVFVALGGSSVVASSGGSCTILGGPGPSCDVPAGRTLTFWGNGATYIAAITASSSSTIVVYMGNGPVAASGGGGGGTGGSGLNQLTGDVTAGPGTGSQAATVVNGSHITNASIPNGGLVNAGVTIGSTTGGVGVNLGGSITTAQLTGQVSVFAGSSVGLVPTSSGGTTNFLRADGTFASPAGNTLTAGAGLSCTSGSLGGSCPGGATIFGTYGLKAYTTSTTLLTGDNADTILGNSASAINLTVPTGQATNWAVNICNENTGVDTILAGTGTFYPITSPALSAGMCGTFTFDGTNWQDAYSAMPSPVNSGALVTNSSGVPSFSTTLPNMALGTPTSATLTNATGLPVASGISGLGTGVATALGTAVSGSGAICLASGSACAGGGVTITAGSTATSGFTNGSLIASLSSATNNSHLFDLTSLMKFTEPEDIENNYRSDEIANAGTTGTTQFELAKLTGAPSTAVVLGTSDVIFAGIVQSASATTGNAVIATSGTATCAFDGATIAGDYVIPSTTTGGKCHDTGSNTLPSQQVVGQVLSTNGASGNFTVEVSPQNPGASTGSGGGPAGIGLISGNYYTAPTNTPTNGLTVASRLYFLPYYNVTAKTWTKISVDVVTSQAGSQCDLGVYANSGGAPTGAPLVDAGSVATTASNFAEISSQTINMTANTWYWLAVGCATSGTMPSLQQYNASYLGSPLGLSTASASFTGYFMSWTFSAGALPTVSGLTQNSSATPFVYLRF